ncbi:hypothetical protein D3C73_853080 [compost metagenome]
MFGEVAFGEDLLGVQHEITQQAKLRGGQLNVRTVAHNALATFVQMQPGSLERWLVDLAMGAAQQRLDAQKQLFGMEWLGQVVVGAGLEAFDAFGPGVSGRQDQHRRGQPRRAPLRQHLKPRHAGQTEVEDDQVVRLGAALMYRIATIGQPVHRIPLAIEAGQQFVGQGHMVFHQEQTHGSVFLVFE